jgi:hypothetical protein
VSIAVRNRERPEAPMDLLVALGIVGTLVLLTWTWKTVHQSAKLEIGERGILDRTLGLGWIRWDEIEGAYQRRSLDQDSVFIRLRLSRRIRRRLDGLKRKPTALPSHSLDIRLDLAGTDVTPVEVVQEIMAHNTARSRTILG